MPIIVCLKNPNITLVVNETIDDKAVGKYDELFPGGVLMLKGRNGKNMVIPIGDHTNVAFLQEVTDEEIEEQEKKAEERRQAQGGRIQNTGFQFSGGGKQRH